MTYEARRTMSSIAVLGTLFIAIVAMFLNRKKNS